MDLAHDKFASGDLGRRPEAEGLRRTNLTVNKGLRPLSRGMYHVGELLLRLPLALV